MDRVDSSLILIIIFLVISSIWVIYDAQKFCQENGYCRWEEKCFQTCKLFNLTFSVLLKNDTMSPKYCWCRNEDNISEMVWIQNETGRLYLPLEQYK